MEPLGSIPDDIILNDYRVWRFIEDKLHSFWADKDLYIKMVDKYVKKANTQREEAVAKGRAAFNTYQETIFAGRKHENYHIGVEKKVDIERVPFMPEFSPLRIIDAEELRQFAIRTYPNPNSHNKPLPDFVRAPAQPVPEKKSLLQTVREFFTPLGT